MSDKIRAETNFKIVLFFVNEISFSTHKLKKSDLKLGSLAANRENRRCNYITDCALQLHRERIYVVAIKPANQKKLWIGTLLTTKMYVRDALKKVRCIFHRA